MSLEQITQSFLSEASDILDDLEARLIELEEAPSPGTVDAIFRALHTVKGSGGMFGFIELSEFAHHFETAFEEVRAGRRGITSDLVGAALSACDLLRAFLDVPPGSTAARDISAGPAAAAILAGLGDISHETPPASASEPVPVADREGESMSETTWRVSYRPAVTDLLHGARPDLLVEELLALGEGRVWPLPDRVPPLRDLRPGEATLAWIVEVTGEIGRTDIEDVFVFSDDAEISIDPVVEEGAEEPRRSDVADDDDARSSGAAAPGTPDEVPSMKAEPKTATLRVRSGRIDDMMDTLGELVIAQSRLTQLSAGFRDAALDSAIEDVERLILSLRESTLSMRMLPVETVFGKFRRVVRDLSASLGKSAELDTRGGETEVDKNVLDQLSDPLVHMLRNALDHGLETPEERIAAGKPATGIVRLSARQEGGAVILEIADDGRGLNTDRIRARAIEQGLLTPDDTPTDELLVSLIFAPGFSTAEAVSDVSGRGVGMDAVRGAIDALGGSIAVSSKPGRGARVTLTLPVSLAIVDGLRVRVGGQVCVIPLSAVVECVDMPDGALVRRSGRRSISLRGDLVPILPMEDMMGWTADAADISRRRVVVVRATGQRIGFVVDEILGQAQTVIKPLSPLHAGCQGVAGATILGDGSVALIVDVAGAISSARADPRVAA